MGGDGFDPRGVWSPSGGWHADPRYWRRNTAVAFGVLAVVTYGIASVSAKLEVRPRRRRLRRAALARRVALHPPHELGLRSRARAAPRGRARACKRAGGCVARRTVRSAALRVPRLSAPNSSRRCVGTLVAALSLPSCVPQQRPLAPIRPIPSQRWCDNFPKEEAKK